MYQLVFKGECTPGTDPQVARDNARNLFKASVEQIDRMFSGQPVVIRNRLEQVQAEKYQAVMRKHGMVAYIQPMAGTTPPKPPEARPETPAQPASRSRTAGDSAGASAPSGTTSSPQPAAARGQVPDVEPGDRLSLAGERVDDILAGSGLSLDPAGVTLVEPEDVAAPEFEHLDDWSVAPAGSDIGVERDLPPPAVPDVSHLSLKDDASDNQKES